MSLFDQAVLDAAAHEREVQLTTWGRKTGKPTAVTVWISTDGARLFIRSGRGLGRDWPQNLLAHGRGQIRLGGTDVPVRPRHVTDPTEARAISALVVQKYGPSAPHSREGESLTLAEQATFELLPEKETGSD